ncbi:hypothetical protein D3C81_2229060 [compost metagenome]
MVYTAIGGDSGWHRNAGAAMPRKIFTCPFDISDFIGVISECVSPNFLAFKMDHPVHQLYVFAR